jgi:DNA polymerase
MLGAKRLRENTLRRAGVLVSEEVAQSYITAFRIRYGRVVAFWQDLREAATGAVRDKKNMAFGEGATLIRVRQVGQTMYIEMPGGQRLYYHGARYERIRAPWSTDPKDTVPAVTAYAASVKGWGRRPLSPGLMTENIVQALAREVMADGMLRAAASGHRIVLTVHDEVVVEVEERLAAARLRSLAGILSAPPPWAAGLPLAVEGKVLTRYGK